MIDETYTMNDAGEDSDILVTYDQEKSMKTIAWTRQVRKQPGVLLPGGTRQPHLVRAEL